MAISQDRLDRLNSFLADIATKIQARQSAFFANKGRYWQGVLTPSTPPTNTAQVAPDLTLKPTDQAESWADFNVSLPATLNLSIAVDVYTGPAGRGYVMRAIVIHDGAVYERTLNVGPDTSRTHNWQVIR